MAAVSDIGSVVRLGSFNIRFDNPADGPDAWEHRREQVVDVIQRQCPDVLAVQECLPHQAAFLRDRLPEFAFVGVGRDDGVRGEMVPLFVRRDRFEVVTEGHFWLSDTPHLPGSRSWGNSVPRMTSWAALRSVAVPGQMLWAFSTHFDHRSIEARQRAAALMRRWVDALGERQPVVVLGDLNAEPGSPELAPLFGPPSPTRLIDLLASLPEGTHHHFTGRPLGRRIDWLLATFHVMPRAVQIDRTASAGRYPSDHFPVFAEVELMGR
ncbi:MAG: endonuclease/exonuclease/phosphatase family protein [Gemmataceae bacterium]